MAYIDILNKHKKKLDEKESEAPILKMRDYTASPDDKFPDSPYNKVIQKYKHKQRVRTFDEGTRNTEASIYKDENPSIKRQVIDTVKGMPNAAGQNAIFAVTHPLKAARAVGTGLLDVGPRIVNTASWLGRSILSTVYGKDKPIEAVRLPNPSETLAEYLDYERSDEEKAISEATTIYTGYKIGESPFKAAKLNPFATEILGDVVGGQLVTESEDLGERATQAVFDGLFGATTFIGGKVIRGVKGKNKATVEGGEVTEVREFGAREPGSVKNVIAGERAASAVNGEPGSVKNVIRGEKAPAQTTNPKTAYVAKQDLGVDGRGKKVMATTEVDTKTGDAVVYYLKELDENPQLKEIVFDFEEPHILDKRLSQTGSSFTPALKNPSGNISILEGALGTFAKKMGQSVEDVSITIRDDIQKIAKNDKVITEQFADAYGIYKNAPDKVRTKAPVLAKFFEHQLVEPRFSKTTTTEASLAKDFPQVKNLKQLDETGERIKEVKAREMAGVNRMSGSQKSSKSKAVGMQMAAIERKIRGNPTGREIEVAKDYLNSNHRGKVATVDGEPVTLTGKASFGKHEVVFKDGTNRFVDPKNIKAKKATNETALEHLKKEGQKELEGRERLYGIEVKKSNPVEKKEVKAVQFVSPNTKQNLTAKQVEKNMKSPEYQARYDDISNSYKDIGVVGDLKKGKGDWGDGREETFIKEITNNIPDDQRIYALAKQAKELDQTDAIDFKISKDGPDELFLIDPKGKNPDVVANLLNEAGITFKTIGDDQLYVVNKSGEYFDDGMVDKFTKLEENSGIAVTRRHGEATFITGLSEAADRPIAQSIYDNIIKNYENRSTNQTKGDTISRESVSREEGGGNKKEDGGTKKEEQEKFVGTSLDTGKRVTSRSSFNLKTIDAPEDVDALFKKMDIENKNFGSQRISKGNEDLKDLARMVGLKEDELIDLQPGSIANAETLVAARQLVLNKAADLSNKLKGFDIEKATLAQKAEVKDAFLQLVSMQKSVAGLRTEASNVLRSFGVKLKPGENIAIDELITNLKKVGLDDVDPTDINALSKSIGKFTESMESGFLRKNFNRYLQTWYASILSGPKTTARNVLSTAANIGHEMLSKVINPMEWKEVIPAWQGLIKGFTETFDYKTLRDIFALKAVDDSTGKFYDSPIENTEKVFTGKFEIWGRITEIPGRFLNEQDKIFSSALEGMEQASLKVYNPEITTAVSKAISESYGISSVYRGTPKGRFFEGAVLGASKFLSTAPEARLIMPFVRTIGNVLDRQFDYMPIFSMLRLGKIKVPTGKGKFVTIGTDVIERQVERIAKDFGLKSDLEKDMIRTRLRDQQIGRMVLGLGLTAGAVAMAKDGRLSGSGPTNYSERMQLQRTGWRPNSIKVGDVWIPYTYLGPMGGILSIGGNIYDSVTYNDKPDDTVHDLVVAGMFGWMKTQLDNSFLTGIRDLIEATKPGYSENYLKKFAVNLTPIPQAYIQTKDMSLNIIGSALGDESFKHQYETRTYVESIRKSLGLTGEVPGIFDALNKRYDMYGEPMTSDLIWGISPSVDKRNSLPVEQFLIDNEVVVSLPVYTREYTTPNGDKRQLTADEFNKYVSKSGKEIYTTLQDIIPSLEGLEKEEVKKEVSKIASDIRKRYRDELLYE